MQLKKYKKVLDIYTFVVYNSPILGGIQMEPSVKKENGYWHISIRTRTTDKKTVQRLHRQLDNSILEILAKKAEGKKVVRMIDRVQKRTKAK